MALAFTDVRKRTGAWGIWDWQRDRLGNTQRERDRDRERERETETEIRGRQREAERESDG